MKIRILAIAALAALSIGAFGQGPSSGADEMIAAINAVKMPQFDASKQSDKAYVQEYIKAQNEASAEKARLILDFYKAYPSHEKLAELLPFRWNVITRSMNDIPRTLAEVDGVIAANPSEKVMQAAMFTKANFGMINAGEDEKKAKAAVQPFLEKYPTDARGAGLMSNLAEVVSDRSEKLGLYNKVLTLYPEYRGKKYIPGKIKQIENLGKPFELSFTDAITGQKKTMADYKGKVVVIDFWATWCGPCVAELPKMKQMYKDLHDQGLEMISVSLDVARNDDPAKDGLKKLQDFVGKNEMPWSHYYQGNYWDSEFSTSWGINSIPCLFLVDQNGNLVDVKARENIADRVKALLAKNK